MKKTLFALFAMAGMASAGTTAITLEGVAYTDSVIVTAELSLEQLTTILWTNNTNKALIGLTDSAAPANVWSTVVGTWGGKQEMLITSGIKGGESFSNAGNLYYSGDNWPSDKDVGGYFSSTNAVKGAITLAYGGDKIAGDGEIGTSILISVLYKDGTVKSLYGNRASQRWSWNHITEVTYADDLMSTPEIIISNTRWTESSLTSLHTELLTIPEPTTATLSLLALAGLAARRRRK